MNPAAIRQLRKSLSHREIATPRFLLRWVAWEATQFRTLVAAAHARGWAVKDAETVLDDAKISSMASFEKTLRALLDSTETPIVPETWEVLLQVEKIRNKLVHGVQSFGPATLDRLSDFLDIVTDHSASWIGTIEFPTQPHAKPVIDPLARLKPHGRRGQTALPEAELRALIKKAAGANLDKRPRPAQLPVAKVRKMVDEVMKSVERRQASPSVVRAEQE